MAKPKRRRSKRRRATNSRGKRSRPALAVIHHRAIDQRSGVPSYRPRDQIAPASFLDWLDRHVSAATETESSLRRYLQLLHFGRSTALLLAGAVIVSCLLFGLGVSTAALFAGVRPWTAVGFGAAGTTTFIVTAIFKGRGYLKAVVCALASVERIGSLSDPLDADQAEQEASGQ